MGDEIITEIIGLDEFLAAAERIQALQDQITELEEQRRAHIRTSITGPAHAAARAGIRSTTAEIKGLLAQVTAITG